MVIFLIDFYYYYLQSIFLLMYRTAESGKQRVTGPPHDVFHTVPQL